MKQIIDIDGMESTAKPLSIDDVVRGVSVREIHDEWLNVTRRMGNPPLKRPIIMNDPDHPVHFGITMKWRVMLNIASVPPDLQGQDMLAWLKRFPMYHEIAHYVFCPYDGITHAKLAVEVLKNWEAAMDSDYLFVINYFSDIIVNNELYKMNGDDFFVAMQRWIEYTVVETYNNGFNVSLEYMVFVLIHELMWKRSFTTFVYPDVARKLAVKMVDIIQFSDDWYGAIGKMTRFLKQVIDHDRKPGNGGFDKSVVTAGVAAKLDKPSRGDESDARESEQGKQDAAGSDGKKDGNDGKDSPDGGAGKKTKNKVMTRVKKDGTVSKSPFDIAFFMGDPTAEKTKGSIDEQEKQTEKNEIVSIIAKTGMGFGASAGLMRIMNIANTDDQAWRLWLRARARRVMEYDTAAIQERKGGSLVPSEWEWGMPVKDWNPLASALNFPVFPFPPFATGMRDHRGSRGNATIPDVRDLVIVRDSSRSMINLMDDSKGEKWTRSIAIGNKMNNKFNLSSLVAFSVLHAAAARGAKISVINFSSDCIVTPWMTSIEKDVEKAERVILQFIGTGTMLPVTEIKRMLAKKRHCFVLLVTDSQLNNWNSFFSSINDFKRDDHEMAMIFISNGDGDIAPALHDRLKRDNITVHVVTKPSDLFAVTVREIDRVYK